MALLDDVALERATRLAEFLAVPHDRRGRNWCAERDSLTAELQREIAAVDALPACDSADEEQEILEYLRGLDGWLDMVKGARTLKEHDAMRRAEAERVGAGDSAWWLKDPPRPVAEAYRRGHRAGSPVIATAWRKVARDTAVGRALARRPPQSRGHAPRPRRRISRTSRCRAGPSDDGPGDLADDDPVAAPKRNSAGWLPCPFCGQPLVEETDGTHCGGCAITWWELAL